MRTKQWIKNLLVFAPLIFAHELIVVKSFERSAIAFICFCILSSSVYLINDLNDLEADKHHPVKRNRPLASGKLNYNFALFASFILLAISLSIGFWLGKGFLLVCCIYFVLIYSYSYQLKKIVVLDVIVVALGFVLRAIAGAVVINVEFSSWLLVTTLFLSLFLALGKRRHELMTLGSSAGTHRKILQEYSEVFLDQLIVIVAAAVLISYALYTLSSETITRFGTDKLVYTLPVVVYGLFRYFYLVYQKDKGGDPTETLYSDIPLLVSILLWAALAVVIIYNGNYGFGNSLPFV